MSAETRKVLEMLAEGKITADDAERLLDKLAAAPDDNPATGNGSTQPAPNPSAKKFLRVLLERPGGDDVNVRVPLNFVRSGVKLAGILPPKVLQKLEEEGLDAKLFSRQAEDSLDLLNIDMQTKSGKHIRVFCE
jgi:hypothetical protein